MHTDYKLHIQPHNSTYNYITEGKNSVNHQTIYIQYHKYKHQQDNTYKGKN